MPRRPREQIAGGIFHVYARGNRRQDIFLDDRDRLDYLRLLGAVVVRQRWHCLAYCLMPNHVHLLLETPAPNLSAGMQQLHGTYAQDVNKRHGLVGHLFQGRFGNSVIGDDDQLARVIRYVTLNPVAAGLAASAVGWPWSSHAAIVHRAAPPWLGHTRLLAHLEGLGLDPCRTYATLTEDGPPIDDALASV